MIKRHKNINIVGGGILLMILIFSFIPHSQKANYFHTDEERAYFSFVTTHVPVDSALIFPVATACEGCHGKDPLGNAYVDNEGNEINVFDDWQTSMMANSAKDPFWRAKVSHEVATFPQHQVVTEDKCTSCHAPQGHFTHHVRGKGMYGFSDLLVDTVGLDGVSCGACHQMSQTDLGNLFSGELIYDTTRIMYGPFEFPFAAPMADFVGFTPEFSEHINDEGLCAGCHTLVTNSYDTEGNETDNFFAEQATYHEWLNSIYSRGEEKRTCQSCHLPQINDSIVISANFAFLEGRSPFGLHELVGGNVTMLNLMKDNKEALDIVADDLAFDETIEATMDMLQSRSLALDLALVEESSDTVSFTAKITNLAGHKFPSGYPSRRAVLQFVVLAESGDTLFRSGVFDDQWEVNDLDPEFEPHYNVIDDESKVQIYEFVTGNSEGEFTTLLEQAFVGLKDNRIPPRGFRTTHSTYDTVTIVGNALQDEDFNLNQGAEGSGSDIVHYNIPLQDYSGIINVYASVIYQPLPPRWLQPMLDTNTPEIATFKAMFEANDNEPVFMISDTIANLFVNTVAAEELVETEVRVFPNPSIDGSVVIESDKQIRQVTCSDNSGRSELMQKQNGLYNLPEAAGIYYLKIFFQDGTQLIKKVMRP